MRSSITILSGRPRYFRLAACLSTFFCLFTMNFRCLNLSFKFFSSSERSIPRCIINRSIKVNGPLSLDGDSKKKDEKLMKHSFRGEKSRFSFIKFLSRRRSIIDVPSGTLSHGMFLVGKNYVLNALPGTLRKN